MPEELTPLDAIEEPTWRALARFFVAAPRLLDEDLQRGAHISLSAYTILLHLSEAPGWALRITELASRAYLSGSRTTRLVDELIADQLVTKQRNAADGRGFDVTLTEKGLAGCSGPTRFTCAACAAASWTTSTGPPCRASPRR